MQPQRREVRVENDEYEREQQAPSVANKARGRLEKLISLRCVLCGAKPPSHP